MIRVAKAICVALLAFGAAAFRIRSTNASRKKHRHMKRTMGKEQPQELAGRAQENTSKVAITSHVAPEQPSSKRQFSKIGFMDKSWKPIAEGNRTRVDQITVRFRHGVKPYSKFLELPDAICFDWDGTLATEGQSLDQAWRDAAEVLFRRCEDLKIKLYIVSAGTSAKFMKEQMKDLTRYFESNPSDYQPIVDEQSLRSKDFNTTWATIVEELEELGKDEVENPRMHRIWGSESKLTMYKSDFVKLLWPALPSKPGKTPVVMMVDDAEERQSRGMNDQAMEFFKQGEGEETITMSYHFKPKVPIFHEDEGKIRGVDILQKFLKLPFGQPDKLSYVLGFFGRGRMSAN